MIGLADAHRPDGDDGLQPDEGGESDPVRRVTIKRGLGVDESIVRLHPSDEIGAGVRRPGLGALHDGEWLHIGTRDALDRVEPYLRDLARP